MIWALDDAGGGARASVVVRPSTVAQVQAVLRVCNDARVPVTAAAGRSGVCGASVPVFGGVLLDLHRARRDRRRRPHLDARRRAAGHVRRRVRGRAARRARRHVRALAAVDGAVDGGRLGRVPWRRAALDALRQDRRHRRRPRRRARRRHASSTPVAAPRAAVGPDLTQLFVGSEGTLGVIVGARLRAHPVPAAEVRARVRVLVLRRRPRRDAPHRAAGRDARGAAPVRRDRGRPQLPDRRRERAPDARRRRRARRRRDPAHRRRGMRGGRRDSTSASSSSG